MSNASTNPVRRPARELHTADIGHERKPSIETFEDLINEVIVAPIMPERDYATALQFNEDPVTIRIERGSEKFAPPVIDCWVNGKGAEVLINGRWRELRFLPVGIVVTTKRKYVEVLAASKIDSIQTNVIRENDSERNLVERFPSSRAPFSVLEDKNPKGVEWLTNLVRFG